MEFYYARCCGEVRGAGMLTLTPRKRAISITRVPEWAPLSQPHGWEDPLAFRELVKKNIMRRYLG